MLRLSFGSFDDLSMPEFAVHRGQTQQEYEILIHVEQLQKLPNNLKLVEQGLDQPLVKEDKYQQALS